MIQLRETKPRNSAQQSGFCTILNCAPRRSPMRILRPLHSCLIALVAVATFGQAPLPRVAVPADPHELATGETIVASDAGQRGSVLSLLERARQNAELTMPGEPSFTLKASFEAIGPVTYVGSGEMTESWIS